MCGAVGEGPYVWGSRGGGRMWGGGAVGEGPYVGGSRGGGRMYGAVGMGAV